MAVWQNLAQDAVDDIFKAYVGDQLTAVIREQISVATFITNILKARDKRDAVNTAIDHA